MQGGKALGESRVALGAACDGKLSNLIGRICFHARSRSDWASGVALPRLFLLTHPEVTCGTLTVLRHSNLCCPSCCSSSGAHAEAGQALCCPPQLARSVPPPGTAPQGQAQAPPPSSCPTPSSLPHPPRRGERRATPPGHRCPSVWSEHATQGFSFSFQVVLICTNPSMHLLKMPQNEEQ